MVILLLSFGSRIAMSAIPHQSLSQKTTRILSAEKPDASENQAEEKLKVEDIIVPTIINLDFFNVPDTKSSCFAGNFNLTINHLPTLEYPPK